MHLFGNEIKSNHSFNEFNSVKAADVKKAEIKNIQLFFFPLKCCISPNCERTLNKKSSFIWHGNLENLNEILLHLVTVVIKSFETKIESDL